MINKLHIQSLKSINNIIFNCSNLNIFIGTNSSGKSTALQALLLLAQNAEVEMGCNGPLISLGNFREVKSLNTESSEIEIKVENDNSTYSLLIKEASINGKEEVFTSEDITPIKHIITEKNIVQTIEEDTIYLKNLFQLSKKRINYLSCHRIGVHDIYDKNLLKNSKFGINGEFSIDYLLIHKSDTLEKILVHPENEFDYTLFGQVNVWLKYIINANLKVEDVLSTDFVKVNYSVFENMYVRPRNVGSGISYLVSIIIAGLSCETDDILIIENPEIHLHPQSQSKVIEFLYFIAKAGRQIFVETHSDHIFNGIRSGIATGDMDDSKISVNFLNLNEYNITENIQVNFGKNGRILNQQRYMFDQFDIDLNKMLGF
jgi:predicted ATPase